ncbi:MAG: hypothetical protein JWP12_1019 [Bacteroidetes bacterium]|nr:hypothetical protein [Bacteroidota bacterium]
MLFSEYSQKNTVIPGLTRDLINGSSIYWQIPGQARDDN